MNYFNNINLNQNELQKAVMHPLAQPPATAKEGQMYFNTVDKKLYYYDDTKWVALNDIDLSNYVTTTQLNDGLNKKLDKKTTADSNTQVYAVTGNTQKMIDATSAATKDTVALRDANGRLQVADGAVAADAVNKGQMDTAIATAIKVKDVTLDGTSIVNAEGIVALESTYSLTLENRTSGTLQQTEYDNLSGDDASYIWYIQTGVQPIRLTKVMSGDGSLQYQAVVSDTVMAVTIQSDKTWEFVQFDVENAANKKTTIAGSGNDTDYPTTKAVADYVGKNYAPKDHATTATTYGLGTTQNYGHVKLVTGDMNGKANANGQVPSLNHTHGQYALLSGATFTGDIKMGTGANPTIIGADGNVTIGGNLTVQGTTTTVESATLKVKDQLIEVASGNTVALTSPAGLVVPKYDGTNNGALVFDKTGTAYVGDVALNADGLIDTTATGTKLVALAGRDKEANLTNDHVVKWDATNKILVDTGIDASNILTSGELPTDYVSTTKTEPQAIKSSLQLGSDTQNCAFISEAGSYKLIKKGVITEYNADNIVHGSSTLTLPSKTGTIALLSDIPSSPTNMVTTDGNQDITGVKTFKANVILNSTLQAGTSVGTAGQVLTSQGDGKAPQWTTLSLPQGTVRKLAWSIIGDGATKTFENNNTLATAECTVSVYLQVSGATWELVMTDVVVTAAKIQVIFAQAPTNGQSFRVVVTG